VVKYNNFFLQVRPANQPKITVMVFGQNRLTPLLYNVNLKPLYSSQRPQTQCGPRFSLMSTISPILFTYLIKHLNLLTPNDL
jgi:hypothetical protein